MKVSITRLDIFPTPRRNLCPGADTEYARFGVHAAFPEDQSTYSTCLTSEEEKQLDQVIEMIRKRIESTNTPPSLPRKLNWIQRLASGRYTS